MTIIGLLRKKVLPLNADFCVESDDDYKYLIPYTYINTDVAFRCNSYNNVAFQSHFSRYSVTNEMISILSRCEVFEV